MSISKGKMRLDRPITVVKFIIEDYIRAIYQIACAQTPHLP